MSERRKHSICCGGADKLRSRYFFIKTSHLSTAKQIGTNHLHECLQHLRLKGITVTGVKLKNIAIPVEGKAVDIKLSYFTCAMSTVGPIAQGIWDDLNWCQRPAPQRQRLASFHS